MEETIKKIILDKTLWSEMRIKEFKNNKIRNSAVNLSYQINPFEEVWKKAQHELMIEMSKMEATALFEFLNKYSSE